MIKQLSLGLQGRFQGNDNVGHYDSPKGTRVIFSASCSFSHHATSQAELNLAAAGGEGGDLLSKSWVSPPRLLAAGLAWLPHASPTNWELAFSHPRLSPNPLFVFPQFSLGVQSWPIS